MSKQVWPKTVPVLSQKDICTGAFRRGNQGCFIGWLINALPDRSSDVSELALAVIKHKYDTNARSVITWNDSVASKKQVADAFNTTCALLGYVKNNPAAKGVKQLRNKILKDESTVNRLSKSVLACMR